ncbi:hypothetical protein BpHYR1_006566 [Brachionus plicatilis]|uniref:Uncharacterized protein n=1 Tax=Brachionus plicatilis TaxID=10195 RepID=A0A3M7QCS0_BRAPC|nr:hypothetical protein BpHYR1_006566 [Brachionus plicatilis]
MNCGFDIMVSLHLHKRVILSIFGTIILLMFLTMIFQNDKAQNPDQSSAQIKNSQNNPRFNNLLNSELYSLSKKWFKENCLSKYEENNMKFEFIDDYIDSFKSSRNKNCITVFTIFDSMFELDISYGEIRIDEKFLDKVKIWLNNNPDYVKQAYKQKIIKIYNKFHNDEMIYNPLRGKRPQAKQIVSEKNHSLKIIEESKSSCDFCEQNYKINTANEIFDRLETPLSYSAANTFKYDKWHSLIVSRNHDPLNLKEEEIIDMYSLSWEWFKKVSSIDPSAKFPELIWDAMPKSGASQIHTHLQVSMDDKNYYGIMRRWLEASERYFGAFKRDFLDDFILIHKALGLAYELNNCYVIFSLIPLKDNEVMIIGDNDPKSYLTISKLTYQVIRSNL